MMVNNDDAGLYVTIISVDSEVYRLYQSIHRQPAGEEERKNKQRNHPFLDIGM